MIQELIEGFIEQLKKSMKIAQNEQVIQAQDGIQNLVVAGLGGSGIGANLVESLVRQHMPIPYVITKTYDIPNFVDENTLFVASSFSGGTEETLAALEKAIARKAKIFAITSGGKLLEMAKAQGFNYVQIPNEAPCPRAFIGLSFIQLIYALKHFGFMEDFFTPHLDEGVALLESKTEQIKEQAKALAQDFYQKQVIVYGDTPMLPVITRLQQQLNENSKQLCHTNIFPEMNHNELVGWGLEPSVYANTTVLMIRSSFDHERVSRRMEICKPIFAEKASKVVELKPEGESFIAQNIYLIHLFDWASYYLSELNGVDAFEIKQINYLKSELAKF